MAAPGPTTEAVVLTGVVLPERKARTTPALGVTEGNWLCGWCLTRVASDKHRFAFEGKDEFAFSNPEGIRFEIITFYETLDCCQAGLPTLDHTWFPGHAWSFCICDGCGQHLGWFYTGQHEFAGLIKTRIVREVCVRN